MGAILIRLERIGLEVKESFSLQQYGGGGRGKKWKGRGGRRIIFIVPSLPILYSFCIVNPTCHLLKADYKQSLSFGKVCYPEKKILLVVHLK